MKYNINQAPLGIWIDHKRLGGQHGEVRHGTGDVATTLLVRQGSVKANGFLSRRLGASLPLRGGNLLHWGLGCLCHVAWGLVLISALIVFFVVVVDVFGFGCVALFLCG